MFAEGQTVSVHEPLRQGDVVEARSSVASMWTRHLFVVTADCDLAHGKNLGRITAIPFLTADEYVAVIHFAKLRSRILREVADATLEALATSRAANLSTSALMSWAALSPNEEIIEDANVDQDLRHVVSRNLDVLRALQQEPTSVDSTVDSVLRARMILSPARKPESLSREIRNEVESAFSSTPGDALFISEIAPGLSQGYFAYLRHHELLNETDIALNHGRTESPYRRIARLKDRYAHALVQRFATVFMSIGLPDDYETTRQMHATVMKEGIS